MSKKKRSWFGFFFSFTFFFNEMLCYSLAFIVILFYYYYYVGGYPLKSEEGFGFLRARVTGGFGPPNPGNEN